MPKNKEDQGIHYNAYCLEKNVLPSEENNAVGW
jgi:hypothetical protein